MLRRHEGSLLAIWASFAWLGFVGVGGCDGTKFSGVRGEGGEGGDGGEDASGGAPRGPGGQPSAGDAGQAGEATLGGGDNEAGAGAGGCSANVDCGAGTFCDQGGCVSCAVADPAVVEFGNPVALEVINETIELEGLRFARPIGEGPGLVYTRDFFGGALWFTSDANQSDGIALGGPADTHQSGGLPIAFSLPPELSAHDFFFHRSLVDNAITKTTLYGGNLDDAGNLSNAVPLPAPFNQANVAASYSLALSEERAIWTQNINGSLDIHLKTIGLPSEGQEPADLLLPLPFDCGFASELEFAPWLTPDGETLFFTARTATDACMFTNETPSRIYVVGLSSAGEPLGQARELGGLGPEGSRQSDPALSADGCHLFYSSQSDAAMLLYRAERLR
jgi:hypothetical protein